MAKLFTLVLLLTIVLSAYGSGKNTKSSSFPQHYTNLIVGGGPAGLYTAWRLSSRGLKNETTALFEWSPKRLGGRVFTKLFHGGVYLELGAMRFMEGHQLLNQVLRELKLTDKITDFPMTSDRLYYVRDTHFYQSNISNIGVPYKTTYRKDTPEAVFDIVAKRMHPLNDTSRAKWCTFFDEATFPANVESKIFSKNDRLGNIGFWNLLMDQLDDEGLSYLNDAGGFTANVINSNAAFQILEIGNFGPPTKLKRLITGFWKLISTLEKECVNKSVQINKGQRLTEFYWNARERKFHSKFVSYNENGVSTGKTLQVTSDRLFLCVPRHSLELIEEKEVVGNSWPANKERRVLKHSRGKFYMGSVIQSPVYKIALSYKYPWWLNATYTPSVGGPSEWVSYTDASKRNYGPTVTNLPIRQVYYFGHNIPVNLPIHQGKPTFGVIASYDDMSNTFFWKELELLGNETFRPEHPAFLQPLHPGTPITESMKRALREQLNRVHYNTAKLQVPDAEEGYFMNWGLDPFGSGYHTWKPHYKIAEAMYYMTRPSEAIGEEVPVYVAGEAYSYDQRWIEGAFTTAEAVLVDKIGLKPLLNKPAAEYPFICPFQPKAKK